QPIGIVPPAAPLGEAERSRPEHLPVVDFLERLAVALAARDLADEQDHRRRVLERGVHADRRVARPGGARHASRSRWLLATWPMNRIIGVESWNAVCTPIAALLAPGPRVTKHSPGRPVSLPCASAMLLAPPSWAAR